MPWIWNIFVTNLQTWSKNQANSQSAECQLHELDVTIPACLQDPIAPFAKEPCAQRWPAAWDSMVERSRTMGQTVKDVA